MKLIEAMARAMARKHYAERFKADALNEHVQDNVDSNWHLWAEDCRVALKAARTPSFAMVKAPRDFITKAEADLVWVTMIDAALSESTPSPEK